MTPPLFLLDDLPGGDTLHLGGAEGRHAARVKRLRTGETVLISDGRGTVLTCVVSAAGDGLDLRVTGRRQVPPAQPRIVVVQALAKGDRAELAVEVLTELGVDVLVPWSASRSIVQWHGERGERALGKWRSTARESAKQSRRPWVPVVEAAATTAEVAARLGGAACALVLHEDASTPLSEVALPGGGDAAADAARDAARDVAGDVVVVVGPEGGITPDELDALSGAGAVAVRLGDSVLRTSTAGAAAVSALSLCLGRWG